MQRAIMEETPDLGYDTREKVHRLRSQRNAARKECVLMKEEKRRIEQEIEELRRQLHSSLRHGIDVEERPQDSETDSNDEDSDQSRMPLSRTRHRTNNIAQQSSTLIISSREKTLLEWNRQFKIGSMSLTHSRRCMLGPRRRSW